MQLCNKAMHTIVRNIREQARVLKCVERASLSKILRMEGQTERKPDFMSKCMPFKCRWQAAMSPSVLSEAGIVRMYRSLAWPDPTLAQDRIGQRQW